VERTRRRGSIHWRAPALLFSSSHDESSRWKPVSTPRIQSKMLSKLLVLGLAIVSQVGATCYKRHSTTNPTTTLTTNPTTSPMTSPTTSPKTSSTTSPETCHVIVTETAWTTVPTCASTTTETESTTTTSTSTVTVSAYPTHVIRNPSFEDSRDRSWSRQNANLYEVETPDAPAHSGYNRA
jgi:hypothetical protein